MKYNIGDKVIKEKDLDFLFNPYWKDNYRKGLIRVVTEANEKEFTIYNNKGYYESILKNGHSCGMNNYLIFFQSSGRQYSYPSPDVLLHLEKDKEYIKNKIKEIGEKTFKEDDERYKNNIAMYEKYRTKNKETYIKDLEYNLNLVE